MGKISMRVDINSYMGGSIYWVGFHHVSELLFLKTILKKEMTFVDIGANQGEFSLFAASILKEGKVIAFEPVSYQLSLLIDNVKLNEFENIEINNYGLLNKSTSLGAFTSDESSIDGGNEGLSSLYKSSSRNQFEEIIDLKVFDEEYFEKLNRLDIVKIDIEGAELFALQGMEKSISKFRPLIILEMNAETFSNAGYKMSDVFEFLNKYSYKPFRISRGILKELDENELTSFSNVAFKVI
jgi:FkbM family methyltransferase